MKLRIFVGYGQWGLLFSPAIPGLASQLAKYGSVTQHNSSDLSAAVAPYLRANSGDNVVVFGYSLSASMLQDVCWKSPRKWIGLGVALDPTRQWGYAQRDKNGVWTQTAPCFRKLVCFYNPGAWPFGGAKYVGDNVQLVTLPWTFHLTAQAVPSVWSTTEAAVKQLADSK